MRSLPQSMLQDRTSPSPRQEPSLGLSFLSFDLPSIRPCPCLFRSYGGRTRAIDLHVWMGTLNSGAEIGSVEEEDEEEIRIQLLIQAGKVLWDHHGTSLVEGSQAYEKKPR